MWGWSPPEPDKNLTAPTQIKSLAVQNEIKDLRPTLDEETTLISMSGQKDIVQIGDISPESYRPKLIYFPRHNINFFILAHKNIEGINNKVISN